VSDLLRILAILALVAGNAFFVIGEYAVVTARRAPLVPRAEAGGAGARAALRLMDDPVRVISTVQVGITAIGILTGAVGEPLVRDLLGGGFPRWLSFLVAFSVVTYLSVVLGELVPKALTLDRAEALVVLVARPVEWLSVLLRPVVWVLQGSAGALLRPFGIREVTAGDTVRSAEELRQIVDEAEGAGVIPTAQEELLHNVFDFADLEAEDIMVPAHSVAWLDGDLGAAVALEQVTGLPHGRYPVGRGTLDDLVGIAYLYDLLRAARDRGDEVTVGELAHPALIVPETKDLGPLLRELRERQQQIAIVVDEYGAVAGIVTLHDLLEELVGEIQEEYELPDATLTWVDDRAVEVSGSISIDDFNETVGTDLPHDGARTLAGLVFAALGRRPEPGDTVQIGSVRLRVEALEGLRITQLRADLPGEAKP
jgi:magnesium and cobalt exporter, CNNM family